jgi:hypothetical protein
MINQSTDYFETCDHCSSRAQERYSSHFTHVCKYCQKELCNQCYDAICNYDGEGQYTHEIQRCEAC